MSKRKLNWRPAAAVLALGLLVFVARLRIGADDHRLASATHSPQRIMGTDSRLIAIAPASRPYIASRGVDDAEQTLRRAESLMSTYLDASQVSQINAAPADQWITIDPQVATVLSAAQRFHERTDGAFDITARPLFQLWRRSAAAGHLPKAADIAAARGASNWKLLQIPDHRIRKQSTTVQIDLGGIAKGYAIDQAIEAMQAAGCEGGLVDVGGDVRVFGPPPRGERWHVGLRDPFSGEVLMNLAIDDRAVCTSGNYARFVEVGGRQYSHIVDPRTGHPADLVPSVTVVAPVAMTADGWATALSVLGEEGLELLPDEVEAMMIIGDREDYHAASTPGFSELISIGVPVTGDR